MDLQYVQQGGTLIDVVDLVNHITLPSTDTASMVGLHGLNFQGLRLSP